MSEVLIGLGLGAAFVLLGRQLARGSEIRLYAAGLVAAALVYVGFALYAGETGWLLVELLGVVFYGVFAGVGVRSAPVFLALGWGLHVGWDGFHGAVHAQLAPTGYVLACLGFDLALAGYLLFVFRRQPSVARPA